MSSIFNNYDGDSIHVAQGSQKHRMHPAQYLGSNDVLGIENQLFEIIDNSIDESIETYKLIDNLYQQNNSNPVDILPPNIIEIIIDENDVVTVKDQGRGMPCSINKQTGEPAIYLIFENDSAGGKGKHGQGGYQSMTSGMHGAGACVSKSCTKFFNINVKTVNADPTASGEFTLSYELGERSGELTKVSDSLKLHTEPIRKSLNLYQTGTTIIYHFDPDVLQATEYGVPCEPYNYSRIVSRLKEILIGTEDENSVEIHFKFKDKPVEIISPKDVSPEKLLGITAENENDLEIIELKSNRQPTDTGYYEAKIYLHKRPESIDTKPSKIVVNRLSLINEPITKIIRDSLVFAYDSKMISLSNLQGIKLNDSFKTKVSKDYSETYSILVIMTLKNPAFGGQTKRNLVSTEFRNEMKRQMMEEASTLPSVDRNIEEALMTALSRAENELKLKQQLKKEEEQRAKDQKKAEIDLTVNNALSNPLAMHKLLDENKKWMTYSRSLLPANQCYLLIVEGNSAGNSLHGQDKPYHVFTVGGKPQNVFKKDVNEQFLTPLIVALKSPYKGILITTDADSDARHIRMLLLAIIHKYAKHYLYNGDVYIINSPNARIQNSTGKPIELQAEDLYGENIIIPCTGYYYSLSQTETDRIKEMGIVGLDVISKYTGLEDTLTDDNDISIDKLITEEKYRKKVIPPTEEDIAFLQDILDEENSYYKRKFAIDGATGRTMSIRGKSSILNKVVSFKFDPYNQVYVDEPTITNNQSYTLYDIDDVYIDDDNISYDIDNIDANTDVDLDFPTMEE